MTQLFDRLSDMQAQSGMIYGEHAARLQELQQKCSAVETVEKSLALHTDMESRIASTVSLITDLRKQVDALIMSPVTSPRTVQLKWNMDSRDAQSTYDKFEKTAEQSKQDNEKRVKTVLALTDSLGAETAPQELERLELLHASTLDAIAQTAALQKQSSAHIAALPPGTAAAEDFLQWFDDRCSQITAGVVPTVQSNITLARSIVVDSSEPQLLQTIARSRESIVTVMSCISSQLLKLQQHEAVRRSYYEVALTVLDNLANERNVYTGVDYSSLIQTTQQLLGQTATPVSLPVPYSPSTVTAAAAAPATSAPASLAPNAASAAAAAPALAFPLPPPAAALYLTPPPPSFS